MDKQPEALKLADDLVTLHGYPLSIKAASELRRLYEVNLLLVSAVQGLLDDVEPCDCTPEDTHCPAVNARKAIAKAGENQ